MLENFSERLCELLQLPHMEESESGLRLNAAARALTGEEDLSQALAQLLGPDCDAKALDHSIAAARDGQSVDHAVPSGAHVLLQPAGEGRAQAVFLANDDRASSIPRRAASADLAAGVSHELANALGAIAGWAKLAQEGYDAKEALRLIETSADNAWTAAKQTLGHVTGEQKPSDIDASELVNEVTKLLMPKATRNRVVIRTSVAPQLHVHGHRHELWTVVWNLAANAVEAMEQGGNLGVELAGDGPNVVLRVDDDGPGMPEELRKRAFDAYFTTKDTGTGLGLSLVRDAVEQLGGDISLDSGLDGGTRFVVQLPRVQESSRRRRRRVSSGKRSSGVFLAEHFDGRVLVIDDDEPLREMVSTAIGMRGTPVVAVGSGEEALALDDTFELAIVDFVLPDGAGDELVAKLRERGIVSTVLLATGMDFPDKFAPGGEPQGLLRKPYELDDLFRRVAEVITESQKRSDVG